MLMSGLSMSVSFCCVFLDAGRKKEKYINDYRLQPPGGTGELFLLTKAADRLTSPAFSCSLRGVFKGSVLAGAVRPHSCEIFGFCLWGP